MGASSTEISLLALTSIIVEMSDRKLLSLNGSLTHGHAITLHSDLLSGWWLVRCELVGFATSAYVLFVMPGFSSEKGSRLIPQFKYKKFSIVEEWSMIKKSCSPIVSGWLPCALYYFILFYFILFQDLYI